MIGGQQDNQKGSCGCGTTERSAAGALPLLLAGLLLRRRRKSA
ncbi:MAG: MYXO-CTERM sorting domain-containing protein [Myxococcales bacterium]|nr:MYXO-CTERM sorting domain-containing protein [Myxococcales bacterium]